MGRMTTDHPTPWRRHTETDRHVHIVDANGASVLWATQDTADRIIAAVNAHEALVVALEIEHQNATAYQKDCLSCKALALARGEVK